MKTKLNEFLDESGTIRADKLGGIKVEHHGLCNISTDDLRNEMERREKEEKAKLRQAPNPLPNPDFSKLHQMVINGVQSVSENDGYAGKDFRYYLFETALEAVYGSDIWKWWNKYSNE